MDFKPVQGPNGNYRMNPYQLAASQTFAVGDPVFLNTSGLVEIAEITDAALLGVAAQDITSSSANDPVLVYDDPRTIFRCQADDSGDAVQAAVGDTCDLIVTGGVFFANIDASATDVIRIVDLYPNRDEFADVTFVLVSIALHQLDA